MTLRFTQTEALALVMKQNYDALIAQGKAMGSGVFMKSAWSDRAMQKQTPDSCPASQTSISNSTISLLSRQQRAVTLVPPNSCGGWWQWCGRSLLRN